MTNLSTITNGDRIALANITYEAVMSSVRSCYELQRIADHFSGGDVADAFRLCFDKGLSEWLKLCDQDDEEQEAEE